MKKILILLTLIALTILLNAQPLTLESATSSPSETDQEVMTNYDPATMTLDQLKFMSQEKNFNEKMEDGTTLLMRVAEFNPNLEVVKYALEHGLSINETDVSGNTALMLAASENPNPEVISLLVENGSDLNVVNYDEMCPLALAVCYNPNPKVTSALIDAGADINYQTIYLESVLMLACKFGENMEPINVLLEAGPNLDVLDIDGYGVLDYLKENETPAIQNSDLYDRIEAMMD